GHGYDGGMAGGGGRGFPRADRSGGGPGDQLDGPLRVRAQRGTRAAALGRAALRGASRRQPAAGPGGGRHRGPAASAGRRRRRPTRPRSGDPRARLVAGRRLRAGRGRSVHRADRRRLGGPGRGPAGDLGLRRPARRRHRGAPALAGGAGLAQRPRRPARPVAPRLGRAAHRHRPADDAGRGDRGGAGRGRPAAARRHAGFPRRWRLPGARERLPRRRRHLAEPRPDERAPRAGGCCRRHRAAVDERRDRRRPGQPGLRRRAAGRDGRLARHGAEL
ncbi:MAG: hypothetical protein AVDCRST_MAG52-276, partial [uncultured Blastococcus sp.]